MTRWIMKEEEESSSSDNSLFSSSRRSRGRKTHKKPFFKLDVKFGLYMFLGESNVEKVDNRIRRGWRFFWQ